MHSQYFDGEAVLALGDELHLLNPVAALVWQCCDGESSATEIAEDLAEVFGADPGTLKSDVEKAIGEFESAGLLVPDEDGAGASQTRSRLLTAYDLDCESCMEAEPRAFRTVLEFGCHLVVVGFDTEDACTAVEAAFSSYIVRHSDIPTVAHDARPAFSLTLATSDVDARGIKPLHLLYRGGEVVVSGRDASRVLNALASYLAFHGDLSAAGVVAIPGLVVAKAGTKPGEPVMLLEANTRLSGRERRLAKMGIMVADSPAIWLDPATNEVLVGAPGISFEPSFLLSLAEGFPLLGADIAILSPGRYPVHAVSARGAHHPLSVLLAFAPPNEGWPLAESALEALDALLESVEIIEGNDIRE
ncbi:Coenzyme PQQ synthesis protein D (PqqD) [Actinobacteria bacterium IMCC26256]|nr:Coenzyme PQQ synthesis protein D (PqqD) [Actinobacteria bacterium IMCC26256]